MTPKILMNSGIGPAENLAASGVSRVRVDSPQIGRNLKDHPAVGIVAYADPKVFLGASAFELGMNWGQYINSVLKARLGSSFMPSTEFGVVGSPGVAAGAFLLSPYSKNGEPDLQLTVFPKVRVNIALDHLGFNQETFY
jgi:choline dehydrogenase-like flavoprotein